MQQIDRPEADGGQGLAAYRLHAARIIIAFLWANFAALVVVSVLGGPPNSGIILGLGLGLALVSTWVWLAKGTAFVTRLVTTLSASCFAALFLAVFAGTPEIIDIHMYFFAVLAICAGWCCWPSLIAAAVLITLHHLTLNYFYPELVFPHAANFARVALHGFVLAVEVGALTAMIVQLTRTFANAENALAESTIAQTTAVDAADEQKRIAASEAKARERLVGALSYFQTNVDASLGAIRRAGAALKTSSENLSKTAAESVEAASDVEQASKRSIADVGAITASTQELATSFAEIEYRMEQTVQIAHAGASRIIETNLYTSALGQSIDRIEQLIGLIQRIATQTNLLALNATIEAARAGEAGRGFSVVAGEVKNLSQETARAVAEIETSVGAIRAVGDQAVASIADIADIIQNIDEYAAEVASAVALQRSATDEIAGVAERLSTQALQLSGQVATASQAAASTSSFAESAGTVSATAISAADRLAAEIDIFLNSILKDSRAA